MKMTRGLVALMVALAFGVTVSAVSYAKFEAVTVAAASIGFTAANINNTTGAHPAATQGTCRLELAQIRFTVDGTTPSATVGTLLEVGDKIDLVGNDTLNNFRAFRTTAVSGQLDCTFYGSY